MGAGVRFQSGCQLLEIMLRRCASYGSTHDHALLNRAIRCLPVCVQELVVVLTFMAQVSVTSSLESQRAGVELESRPTLGVRHGGQTTKLVRDPRISTPQLSHQSVAGSADRSIRDTLNDAALLHCLDIANGAIRQVDVATELVEE